MLATLAVITTFREGQPCVLLGEKQRDPFKGMLVAPGGKCIDWLFSEVTVEEPLTLVYTESPWHTVKREVEEEVGQCISPTGLGMLAIDAELNHDDLIEIKREVQISVFGAQVSPEMAKYIRKSDELHPDWFPVNRIPYDDMPADYRHWLSHAIDMTLTPDSRSFFNGLYTYDTVNGCEELGRAELYLANRSSGYRLREIMPPLGLITVGVESPYPQTTVET